MPDPQQQETCPECGGERDKPRTRTDGSYSPFLCPAPFHRGSLGKHVERKAAQQQETGTRELTRHFRKLPVEVEARQLGHDYDEDCAIVRWCGGTAAGEDHGEDAVCMVPTLEGHLLARSGDWIIKGVRGEFYPCKPDVFEATYEPAAASLPTGGGRARCASCDDSGSRRVHAHEDYAISFESELCEDCEYGRALIRLEEGGSDAQATFWKTRLIEETSELRAKLRARTDAIQAARRWLALEDPAAAEDTLAAVMGDAVDPPAAPSTGDGPSDELRADALKGIAQADRGELVPLDEVFPSTGDGERGLRLVERDAADPIPNEVVMWCCPSCGWTIADENSAGEGQPCESYLDGDGEDAARGSCGICERVVFARLAASPSIGGSERGATVRCVCNTDADGTPIYPPGRGADNCPYCGGRGEVAGLVVMELACPREGCDRRGLRLPDGEVVVLNGCPRLDCPVMRGHGRCAPSSSSGESGDA